MKRSEMILKMQRFYNTRHVMLESQYISLEQFMTEFLDNLEYNGMLPPGRDVDLIQIERLNGEKLGSIYEANEWEPEV